MPLLKSSKIYRGGVTAPSLSFESRDCTVMVDQSDAALEFRFHLASKGGGTTSVLLQIGKDDFHTVLKEIATKMPESVAVLSDCASIANRKNLELLDAARKVNEDEKTRAKSLVESLEIVEKFVKQKYYDAPVGEDEEEERVRDQLQEVISSLRELH